MADQLTLTTKHPPAFAQGLLQRILHVFKAVFVNQRPDQIALQRVADTDVGIGGFEPGNDLVFHRFMGYQTAQTGAALTCRAHRAEQNGAYRHVQIRTRPQDHGVVTAQFKNAAGKARGNFRCHFTAHARAAGGADQGHTRVIDQGFASVAATDNHLAEVVGRIAEGAEHAIKQRLAGQRSEWGFLGGFPDHCVTAHQRQRGVPCPHRDRKVERADDPDHTQRMPGFTHVMAGALGGDGQAIQLAGQPDREVADVDHFLHFTQTFLSDFARLPRHQLAQVCFVLTQ